MIATVGTLISVRLQVSSIFDKILMGRRYAKAPGSMVQSSSEIYFSRRFLREQKPPYSFSRTLGRVTCISANGNGRRLSRKSYSSYFPGRCWRPSHIIGCGVFHRFRWFFFSFVKKFLGLSLFTKQIFIFATTSYTISCIYLSSYIWPANPAKKLIQPGPNIDPSSGPTDG